MISNVNEALSSGGLYSVKSTENDPVKPTEDPADAQKEQPKNVDEYVPGGETEPIGLYKISADEDGGKKIDFDSPEREETCTANTDAVDGEIKSLKEKQQALTRRLKTASESELENIQRQLDQVERELSLKDNDTYRRENTVFS